MRNFAGVLATVLVAVALSAVAQPAAPSASATAAVAAGTERSPGDLPLRRGGDAESALPQAYVAWTMVLVLALGGIFLLRQARAGRLPWISARTPFKGGELRVLSVRAVGAQVTLQVVQWNGKQLLLGCTPQAITVLDVRASEQSSSQEGTPQ